VWVYPYWATLTGVLEALHTRRTRLRQSQQQQDGEKDVEMK